MHCLSRVCPVNPIDSALSKRQPRREMRLIRFMKTIKRAGRRSPARARTHPQLSPGFKKEKKIRSNHTVKQSAQCNCAAVKSASIPYFKKKKNLKTKGGSVQEISLSLMDCDKAISTMRLIRPGIKEGVLFLLLPLLQLELC